MTVEDEVRQASDAFYSALGRMLGGDAGALEGVWSPDEAVVLPPAPPLARNLGWPQVKRDFEFFSAMARNGQISHRDRRIVAGDDLAYTTQIETVRASMAGEDVSFTSRSTTIYRCERGQWRIVLHHIDSSPELAAVVGKHVQQVQAQG